MRTKQVVVVFLFMVVLFSSLPAEKLAVLPQLLKPTIMAVDDQQVYVGDKETIYIYSLKDYKLKAKFGKAGEGPREFLLQMGEGILIYPLSDSLLINSVGKVSFFSKSGVYIKEINIRESQAMQVQMIGKNFVGIGNVMDQKTMTYSMAVNLYDGQFKKIKELRTQKIFKGGSMEFPMDNPAIYAMGDKIVIAGEPNRFSLFILKSDGNKVASITREYKKLQVPEKYKERVYETFKTTPGAKEFFEQIKKMIKFAPEFPPIQAFYAVDNKIYIQTYKEQNNQLEFFVYDINGKFIKQLFLPFSYLYGIRACPTAIKNNTLYQVIENQDDEEWELHGTKIK